MGETQFGRIQQLIGVERGTLSFYLKTLQELGWIRREFPFKEISERRALYRVADPFLAFWYKFVAPFASSFQFSDPRKVYAEKVEPRLAEYMGWNVFEEVCIQWLKRYGADRLGLRIREIGRWWSRDGQMEIDVAAELESGGFLFGECKWRAESQMRLNDYAALKAKIANLPEAKWRNEAVCILFSVGGFAPELHAIAGKPEERLRLVSGADLFA